MKKLIAAIFLFTIFISVCGYSEEEIIICSNVTFITYDINGNVIEPDTFEIRNESGKIEGERGYNTLSVKDLAKGYYELYIEKFHYRVLHNNKYYDSPIRVRVDECEGITSFSSLFTLEKKIATIVTVDIRGNAIPVDKVELINNTNTITIEGNGDNIFVFGEKLISEGKYEINVYKEGYKKFSSKEYLCCDLIRIINLFKEESEPIEIKPLIWNCESCEVNSNCAMVEPEKTIDKKYAIVSWNIISGSPSKVLYNLNGGENISVGGKCYELKDGRNVVNYYAQDLAGNWYSKSTTFYYISTTSDFEVNIISPENGKEYDTSNILLSYNITEKEGNVVIDSVWYSLDDGDNITIGNNKEGEVSLVLLEGDHTITLYANDTYGRERHKSVSFSINIPSPIPTQPESSGSGGGGGGWGYDYTSLKLILPEKIEIERGSEGEIKVVVENTRSYKIRGVKLTIDNVPDEWEWDVYPDYVDIDKNGHKYFIVKIRIPENATENKTIWFQAKSGLKLKRGKTEIIPISKKQPSVPEKIQDITGNQTMIQENVSASDRTKGGITGLFAFVTSTNPIYIGAILAVLVIMIAIAYFHYKDILNDGGIFGFLSKTSEGSSSPDNKEISPPVSSSPQYKSRFR